MKRNLIFICFAIILCSSLTAQEKITSFHFSGYKVVIVPSETFSIEVQNPKLGSQKMKGNSLRLEIADQRGRVPKDTVIIHTNKIDYLYLHNSELAMDECFVTDSLSLSAVSSFGSLNAKADYLNVNLSAGSQIQAKGETKYLVAEIGAGSSFDSKSLLADDAEVDAVGHSIVSINAKKVIRLDNKDSSVQNVAKKQ